MFGCKVCKEKDRVIKQYEADLALSRTLLSDYAQTNNELARHLSGLYQPKLLEHDRAIDRPEDIANFMNDADLPSNHTESDGN